jgi:hypothetical protein
MDWNWPEKKAENGFGHRDTEDTELLKKAETFNREPREIREREIEPRKGAEGAKGEKRKAESGNF